MVTTALVHWDIRPSRGARLFEAVMALGACFATGMALWPWIVDSGPARVLALLVPLLVVLSFFRAQDKDGIEHRSLTRLASGCWQLGLANGRVADCDVLRVWRAWGWVTLQLQEPSSARPFTVTVWRHMQSKNHWHQLRVWAAWDVAMTTRRNGRGAIP